jgi:adenosylhomocysteine nucleosidase
MNLGIMGAMTEEIAGIYQFFVDKLNCQVKTNIIAGREFHHIYYGEHDIYLVFSRWGKVASAITATILIARFQVEAILFNGVAGAAESSLNMGDIVIGERYVQHDMNAEPLFPKFHIPLTDVCYFQASSRLYKVAKQAAQRVANNTTLLQELSLHAFNTQEIKVNSGTLASGDQFIRNKNYVAQLASEIDQLYAVDMESAAVAQVCAEHRIDFVTIRIISDKADGSAHIDFPKFIQQVSSPLGALIVEQFCLLLLAQ